MRKHKNRMYGIVGCAAQGLKEELFKRLPALNIVCGTGEIACLPELIEKAKDYAAEDADAVYLLAELLLPILDRDGFGELFHNIEMPLIEVLADMEMTGVKIDSAFLGEMSANMQSEMELLMAKIYEIAGEVFNINSPQQLSKILFEKLDKGY